MSWWLLLAIVVITVGSRVVALAVLPPPRGVVAEIVRRLPAPLFAALAALSIVNEGPANPAILVAVGCALLAALRWPSLLATLVAGLAGFLVASLIW
jgi:hypothetical protein